MTKEQIVLRMIAASDQRVFDVLLAQDGREHNIRLLEKLAAGLKR